MGYKASIRKLHTYVKFLIISSMIDATVQQKSSIRTGTVGYLNLFIYGLFKEAVSCLDYPAPCGGKIHK
jgi:hypothetical protein